MELKDYLGIIKRRVVMFILVVALVCVANGLYAYYWLKPSYVAVAQVKILKKSYSSLIPKRRRQLSPSQVATLVGWFQIRINILNDRIVKYAAEKLRKEGQVKGDEDLDFKPFRNTQVYRDLQKSANEEYENFIQEQGDYVKITIGITKKKESFIQTKFEKFIRENVKIEEMKDPTTQLPTRLVNITSEQADKIAAISLVNALALSAEDYHSSTPQKEIQGAIGALEEKITENDRKIDKATAEIDKATLKAQNEYKDLGLQEESKHFEEDFNPRVNELRSTKTFYRRTVKGFEEKLQINKEMLNKLGYMAEREADFFGHALENGWRTTLRLKRYQHQLEQQEQLKTELQSGEYKFTALHPRIQAINEKIILLKEYIAETRQKEVLNFRDKKYQELQQFYLDTDLVSVSQDVYRNAIKEISKELGILKNYHKIYSIHNKIVSYLKTENALLLKQKTELGDRVNTIQGLMVVNDVASESSIVTKKPLPITSKGWGLCGLVALLIGIFVVYFLEYIDTRVTTEYDVRRYLNLPVLGVIPHVSRGNVLLTETMPTAEMSEIFNTTATLLRSVINEKSYKSLVVCSALPREGKTTIALNLSIALARKGVNVLLVDTDLRRPHIHNLLGLPNNVGLSTILEQKLEEKQILNDILDIEETVRYNLRDYLLQTSIPQLPNLRILPSGPLTQNPIHIIESGSMGGLIERLKRESDIVIFDTPPVMRVADALSLASFCDACVLVLASGHIEHSEAAWTKHLFNNVRTDMLGVLLNKSRRGRRSVYYKYYYHETKKVKRQN